MNAHIGEQHRSAAATTSSRTSASSRRASRSSFSFWHALVLMDHQLLHFEPACTNASEIQEARNAGGPLTIAAGISGSYPNGEFRPETLSRISFSIAAKKEKGWIGQVLEEKMTREGLVTEAVNTKVSIHFLQYLTSGLLCKSRQLLSNTL